jgi:alkanesulfonate monooxygenase SsuD/methylene tetrahydromethanopterin reductase-like flavin-dependent oxidoreductase (luciferase family)
MDVRLGTLLLPATRWEEGARDWQRAEELGFDVGYTADHLTHATMAGSWWADGFATLAAAAVVTRRMELGTLVASAAVRRAATLARTAATLDDISGGRLVLGLGAGTPGDETADGGQPPGPGPSGERFRRTVELLRALWEPARFDSPEAEALGVVVRPLPEGRTPPHLMLAAHGPKGYDLVAGYGDGWSTYGGASVGSLAGRAFWEQVGAQGRALDAACERVGRDPASVRRSVLLGFGPDRPLESTRSLVDAVGSAKEQGFHEVVTYWPLGGPGDRFWADPDVVAAGVAAVRAA